MSNRPEGGYILMGVTNEGEPCQPVGTCQRRNDFDGANLSSNIRPFVDGEVRVVTQWHELNGFERNRQDLWIGVLRDLLITA